MKFCPQKVRNIKYIAKINQSTYVSEINSLFTFSAVPVTTTPTPSGPLDCDFQESSCSWTIENGLDEFVFYWNRTNGELLLDNSLQGPETDHKGNAKGKKSIFYGIFFIF